MTPRGHVNYLWKLGLIASLFFGVLTACNSELTPPLPGPVDAIGFEFQVDPAQEAVTVNLVTQGAEGLAQQYLPSDTRILVPEVDIALKNYNYVFLRGNRLIIQTRFENITPNAEFLQPFFFTLNADTANIKSARAPLVMNKDLGGDGILSPGEQTSRLTFEVKHKHKPFKFFVDASAVVESAIRDGLVLWNKLGSDSEVLNSEVGPGFTLHEVGGEVIYVPGRYGNATATTGGTTGPTGGYLTMSPDEFFPSDKTQGTVELWLQKRILKFTPYQTPLINIFGSLPYGGGYGAINAYWSDGLTGNGGIEFTIFEVNETRHSLNDLRWDEVPVGEWVHLGFVWDLSGIDGSSDVMRIYRDGDLVATNTDSFTDTELYADPDDVWVAAHHNYARFGEPSGYFDNIKVWDYAKTDFSDRFGEGF